VYSSAAVSGGTVYVGSYDRHLYALDSSTGRLSWKFEAEGPISGTPTVISGIVYFASCAVCVAGVVRAGPERTYGVHARTGRLIWNSPHGDYTPVVADQHRAYLVGYNRLFGLVQSR
jgi:outer membrane protein assembly factor BamB